jgi:hypothetical protein
MTSRGSAYTIFAGPSIGGGLIGVRPAVARLPAPAPLEHALVICGLLLEQGPDRYERAAVRWIGRMLVEQPGVSLRHAELAAAYLAGWADAARHDAATEALGEVGRAVGLGRLATRLARAGGGRVAALQTGRHAHPAPPARSSLDRSRRSHAGGRRSVMCPTLPRARPPRRRRALPSPRRLSAGAQASSEAAASPCSLGTVVGRDLG